MELTELSVKDGLEGVKEGDCAMTKWSQVFQELASTALHSPVLSTEARRHSRGDKNSVSCQPDLSCLSQQLDFLPSQRHFIPPCSQEKRDLLPAFYFTYRWLCNIAGLLVLIPSRQLCSEDSCRSSSSVTNILEKTEFPSLSGLRNEGNRYGLICSAWDVMSPILPRISLLSSLQRRKLSPPWDHVSWDDGELGSFMEQFTYPDVFVFDEPPLMFPFHKLDLFDISQESVEKRNIVHFVCSCGSAFITHFEIMVNQPVSLYQKTRRRMVSIHHELISSSARVFDIWNWYYRLYM